MAADGHASHVLLAIDNADSQAHRHYQTLFRFAQQSTPEGPQLACAIKTPTNINHTIILNGNGQKA
jgi:hypothetical protein